MGERCVGFGLSQSSDPWYENRGIICIQRCPIFICECWKVCTNIDKGMSRRKMKIQIQACSAFRLRSGMKDLFWGWGGCFIELQHLQRWPSMRPNEMLASRKTVPCQFSSSLGFKRNQDIREKSKCKGEVSAGLEQQFANFWKFGSYSKSLWRRTNAEM